MTTNFEVGSVLTGKVTGIQPYGAFVALNDETQGLVHISEITHGYVKDINDHLKVGQEVNVKVLTVDQKGGKISLSIRATEEAPAAATTSAPQKKTRRPSPALKEVENQTAGFNTLKDKLEEWIEKSNNQDLIKK